MDVNDHKLFSRRRLPVVYYLLVDNTFQLVVIKEGAGMEMEWVMDELLHQRI